MNNFIKFGLIIIIIMFIINFFNNYNIVNNKLNTLDNINYDKLPLLNNKIIDNEHQDIVNAIDNLHNLFIKHWQTEDKFFKIGLNNLPNNHKNVKNDIQKHTQQHQNFINKIKQMKLEILKHITHYDIPHFHWLQNNN